MQVYRPVNKPTRARIFAKDGQSMELPLATLLVMFGEMCLQMGLIGETDMPKWPWFRDDEEEGRTGP